MNSILLIDSETVTATALQTTLGRFSFEAELAESSNAAHAALRKREFDLILVEFDLSPRPDGEVVLEPSKSAAGSWSGTGLIRELRAARTTSPILAVWFRSLMGWIDSEALRFFCPGFANELIGSKPF